MIRQGVFDMTVVWNQRILQKKTEPHTIPFIFFYSHVGISWETEHRDKRKSKWINVSHPHLFLGNTGMRKTHHNCKYILEGKSRRIDGLFPFRVVPLRISSFSHRVGMLWREDGGRGREKAILSRSENPIRNSLSYSWALDKYLVRPERSLREKEGDRYIRQLGGE